MKRFAIIIAAITALTLPGLGQDGSARSCSSDHGHVIVHEHTVARATVYRAVCTAKDLNASYSTRAAAVKAARAHQKATGHQVGVFKQ